MVEERISVIDEHGKCSGMDAAVWNVLHDGCIDRVDGELPGTLRIVVAIDYLRERFPEPGSGVVLTLHGCSLFRFEPFDDSAALDGSAVAFRAPAILSAKIHDAALEVCCDAGLLFVHCEAVELGLDTGTPLSLEQLTAVARDYWDDFGRLREPR